MWYILQRKWCYDSDPLGTVVGKRQHDNVDLQDEGAGRKEDGFEPREQEQQRPCGSGTCIGHVPGIGALRLLWAVGWTRWGSGHKGFLQPWSSIWQPMKGFQHGSDMNSYFRNSLL